MTDAIAFSVPGKPVVWQRAGGNFGKDGHGIRRFTPHKVRAAEKAIATIAKAVMAGAPPLSCPLRLMMVFVYEMPASWPRRTREAGASGTIYHTGTPDIDNLSKLVQDALNRVAYQDDSQIAELIVRKRYGSPARTDITISPLTSAGVTPADKRRAGPETVDIAPRLL